MSWIKIKTKDFAALPNQLLPRAKAQMRVEGAYDDDDIKDRIGRAIDWFERYTGVSVFKTVYDWSPDQTDFCNNVARIPFSPVNVMTAKDGAAADVSSSFIVSTMSMHGVGIYALNGAWISGLVVTIESGYANLPALPFGVLDAVLRYTAHLYDHREILVPDAQIATPGWTQDVLATYWMPRV